MKLKNLRVLILMIFLDNAICEDQPIKSPIIEVAQGKLQGIEEVSVDGKPFYSFLGIPFAKPPVGNLSFEDPVKAGKWKGLLTANVMPNVCLQVDMVDIIVGNIKSSGKEDCLYLNVFTPKRFQEEEVLPVMVFIHGGGFATGGAAMYPPYFLMNEDIVLIVIQYRLGVLGFLSTEDSGMPGNIGMKDQRVALKWVQENIKNFGGDPTKVTIFGESAGGSSVHLHMLSPGSSGLFNGVIAQSGTALCHWGVGDQHRKYAVLFGKKVGCSLRDDSVAFKECLKKSDRKSLMLQMNSLYQWGMVPIINIPRVDGDFLLDDPVKILEEGTYNKVNLMTGVTRHEGAFYIIFMKVNPFLEKLMFEELSTYLPYILMIENEPYAANLSPLILNHYLKGKKMEDYPLEEMIEMLSDSTTMIKYDLTTFLHSRNKDTNQYLYEFDHRGEISVLDIFGVDIPKKYVAHGDELFYLFSGGEIFQYSFQSIEDIELRRKVTKLWTNFAKFGNPTPPGSFNFTWNPATDSNFNHLSISATPSMKSYNRKKNINFWRNLNTKRSNIFHYADRVALESKDEL